MKTCENCRYWKLEDKDENIGECCRYPPKIIGVMVDASERKGFNDYNVMIHSATRWPITWKTDRCGEWGQQ